MGNKIVTDIAQDNQFDAGAKARADATAIFTRSGFEPVVLFHRKHSGCIRLLQALTALKAVCKGVDDGEMIVLQYPYHALIMRLFLKEVQKYKRKVSCKLVLLLHDVNYLRSKRFFKGGAQKTKEREIFFFNQADALVVHTPAMREQLQKDGVTSPMYALDVFDYLYEGAPAPIPQSAATQVVFAGNLSAEKSGFLYQLPTFEGVMLHVYGQGFADGNSNPAVRYCGSFPPDTLIENLQGHYGLVWDGSSSNGCQGEYGEYLKYNAPHKLSLYLAAGLPAVVWKGSAQAKFIQRHGVGVVIDNLSELQNLPNAQSEAYHALCERVKSVAQDIRSGSILKKVIEDVQSK
ncbi:MAG: hypothetical protein IKC91_04155 [Clostridia bacterium]|nr:hypothetical protein [Clostridia bacterium]